MPSTCGRPFEQWDLEHPEVAVPGTFGAPRTPFNQPITARRAVRFTGTTLDALDKVRRDTGSTVNDVVLAIVGGALRRYLYATGRCRRRRCWRWCRCRPVSVRRRRRQPAVGARSRRWPPTSPIPSSGSPRSRA